MQHHPSTHLLHVSFASHQHALHAGEAAQQASGPPSRSWGPSWGLAAASICRRPVGRPRCPAGRRWPARPPGGGLQLLVEVLSHVAAALGAAVRVACHLQPASRAGEERRNQVVLRVRQLLRAVAAVACHLQQTGQMGRKSTGACRSMSTHKGAGKPAWQLHQLRLLHSLAAGHPAPPYPCDWAHDGRRRPHSWRPTLVPTLQIQAQASASPS